MKLLATIGLLLAVGTLSAADIPGTVILNKITLGSDAITNKSIGDTIEMKGTPKSVTSILARNAIPTARREEGMACYVTTNQVTYVLVGGIADANWVASTTSGVGTGDNSGAITNSEARIVNLETNLNVAGTIGTTLVDQGNSVLLSQHDPTILGTVGSAAGNVDDITFGQIFQPVRWTQGPVGEPNYIDNTWHLGMNVGLEEGQRADDTQPNLHISYESKFYQNGKFGQEFHVQGVSSNGLVQFRPLSIFAAHDATEVNVSLQGDQILFNDKMGESLVAINNFNNAITVNGLEMRFASNNLPVIKQWNAAGNDFLDLMFLDEGNRLNLNGPAYVVGPRASLPGNFFAGYFFVVQPTTANSGDTIMMLQGPTLTGTFNGYVARATLTGKFQHEFNNQGNGASELLMAVEGTGDPQLAFDVNGGGHYTVGIDNSDTDKFKISASTTLGTSDVLKLDANGIYGPLKMVNNLATGFLNTAAEFQLLLYDDGVLSASRYGIGVASDNLIINSGGAIRFDRTGTDTSMTISDTGNLVMGNNLATGFLNTRAEYQLILYDDGVLTESIYGLGVKSGSLVFNSAEGFSFDREGSANSLFIDSDGVMHGNGAGLSNVTVSAGSVFPLVTNTVIMTNLSGSYVKADFNATGSGNLLGLEFVHETNGGSKLLRASDGLHIEGDAHMNDSLSVAAHATIDGNTTVGVAGVPMTNIRHGTSGNMVLGTVTVTDTGCTANTRYFFSAHTLGTISIPGGYYASTRTASTSFVITSSQPTETSTIDWVGFEP